MQLTSRIQDEANLLLGSLAAAMNGKDEEEHDLVFGFNDSDLERQPSHVGKKRRAIPCSNSVRGEWFSVLHDLGGKDEGADMVFSASPRCCEVALAFCQAAEAFPECRHIASKLTSAPAELTVRPPQPGHSVVGREASRQAVSMPSAGFQSRPPWQGAPRDSFEGSALNVSRMSGLQSDRTQSLARFPTPDSLQIVQASGNGFPVGDARHRSSSGIDTELQTDQVQSNHRSMPSDGGSSESLQAWRKLRLVQDFAFHLFFMVTRMPYQVLGAQCNDLNREYMAGGVAGLLEVIAQYIEDAASELGLWSREVTGASNSLRSRYEQIKRKVQRSLEEVGSSYVPANVGGQKYSNIQWEADQLTRDVRLRFQLEEPHILFIFDFHRKVALLNSRWSAGFYKFGAELNPMEGRIFREEAREFVVMTRSVPNVFTRLYMDIIQAARYHCSRFQLGLHNDRQEFGLQLTFVRFLSDHMKSNLKEPAQGIIQLVRLSVPRDAFYEENLVQLYEAGLLRIEDLDAENMSSGHRQQEDVDLQRALELSKTELQSKSRHDVNQDGDLHRVLKMSEQDTHVEPSKDSTFGDFDIQMAQALSISLIETQQHEKAEATSHTDQSVTIQSEKSVDYPLPADHKGSADSPEAEVERDGHVLGSLNIIAHKKIVLIQNFAFHLFFMATRMPYKVLGAQCNGLNREYAAGGIVGLCGVVAQYVEGAAAGLQLWSDSADTAPNKTEQCYKRIKTMVQNSLKEVEFTASAPSGWNQKYRLIRQEVEHLSHDIRSKLLNFEPYIVFVFDLHRILSVINADWSVLFYETGKQQRVVAPQLFKSQARDFVMMTRSVPHIFTDVYVDALQVARYYSSRFHRGVQQDSQEFGVQLTFIRFLIDNMKLNLNYPDGNYVQFVILKGSQSPPSTEKLTQFFDAGLLSVDDLYAENSREESPYTQGGHETADEQFQMAIQLSKQEAEVVDGGKSEAVGKFDDLDLAVAEFLSLEDSRKASEIKLFATESPSIRAPEVQGNKAASVVVPGNVDGIVQSDVQVDGPSVGQPTQKKSSELHFRVPDELATLLQSQQGHVYRLLCIEESKVEAQFLRVDIVGRDHVGKTSLARSLMSEKFDHSLPSTEGIDPLEIQVFELTKWRRCGEGCGFDTLGNHAIASSVAQNFKKLRLPESGLHAQTADSAIDMSGEFSYISASSAVRSHQSHAESLPSALGLSDTNLSISATEMSSPSRDPTCLPEIRPRVHVIPEYMKKLIGRYYSGDLRLDVSPDRLYLTVFDYGGHAVYSPSNAPFLSKNGLKLLVFNASESLDGKCPPSVFRSRVSGESCLVGTVDLTNWEILEDWLSYIYLTAPKERIMITKPKERYVPLVSLVATHKDKAEESHNKLDEWLTEQNDYITGKLESKKVLQHILPGHDRYSFTCVDNTISGEATQDNCDEGIVWLKNQIRTVANEMCRPVPVRWLMIGKIVKDLKDDVHLVVVHEELRSMVAELKLIRDDKEFTEALEFLSDKGLLVSQYLHWRGRMQKVVITDLNWLVVSFCRILNVRSGNQIDGDYVCDYGTLVTKAIMTQRLVDYLLGIYDKEHKEVILQLMMAYDLICLHTPGARRRATEHGSPCPPNWDADSRCSSSDGDDDDDDDDETDGSQYFHNPVYIVPSMLKPRPQRTVPESSDCQGQTVTSLWFRLPEGRFPEQAIHRLLTHLVKKYPIFPQIFYREGVFNVRRGHMLRLLVEDRYLRLVMYITNSYFSAKSQHYCDEARQHIQDKVSESLKRDMPRIGDLQRGIMVTVDGSKERTFAIVKTRRSSGDRYLATEDRRRVDISKCARLYLWFKDMKVPVAHEPEPSTRTPNPRSRRRYVNIQTLLDESRAGYSVLQWVALLLDEERESGDDWRALYKHLFNCSIPDRRRVSELSHSPTIGTLELWRTEKESNATVRNLISALSAIRRNDVANILWWDSASGSIPLIVNIFNYYHNK